MLDLPVLVMLLTVPAGMTIVVGAVYLLAASRRSSVPLVESHQTPSGKG